jgi:hypothetical protein
LVGTAPSTGAPAGFAGIFREAHPAVFLEILGWLMRGEVATDPFLLVQSNYAGIFPHHAFVENSTGEHFEVFLFQGYQVTVADFRNLGNSVQRDPAELPFLPQCIAEIPHTIKPVGRTYSHILNHKGASKPDQKVFM